MADLIKWGDMGGWMNLRRLKINGTMILQAFTGRVPSLRSIRADVPWNDLQLQKSRFCELGSLEELTLDGDDMKIPFDILEVYSETLTSLSVHSPEPYHPERRPDIPLADLELLRRTCPRLKTLGIDMNRDGKWPHAYLLELAKFPTLTHLTLSAEGRRGGYSPVLPIIDKDSSKYLFDFLRFHKTGQPLLSLTIQRGGMGSWEGGYPGSNVIDEWNYSARFECRLDSRGDLSVTQIGGETLQGLAGKRLRDMDRWDIERWGSPFSGYDERELGILARLLDYKWTKERLVSAGLLDGVEGGKEEVRQFGGKTSRLLTAFKQVSGEKRVEYQRQLKEELAKVRRKRLMEEAFPDDCTLYDVLRGGK